MNTGRFFKPISSKANDQEREQEFRTASSYNKGQSFTSHQLLKQDCQKSTKKDPKTVFLYLIESHNNKTKLIIYDTQSEREKVQILNTPEPLDWGTSVTQLPNRELFCFGNYPPSGITLIIDSNFEVRILPSGTSCDRSSGIYFNNNVYFFGGRYDFYDLSLSCKFDLSMNRWSNLVSMPKVDACCHSVIFNDNILVSGFENKNLLLYSIDIDSFSTIPYDFAEKSRKILINVERLYLIESSNGLIYESEDEYNWQPISKSVITNFCPAQAFSSYNKGAIYISALRRDGVYKFDLRRKVMTILQ